MRNTFRYSFATVLTAGLVTTPLTAAFAETDGSDGVASGNQIVVPVDIEADLCGNSLAALGISSAECTQVSEVLYQASGHAETDGSDGVASGNQIVVPVDAAIDACGNAVAVGGVSEAECVEVVEVLEEESANTPETLAETDGSGGVASGDQIAVPVDAAIDICGNSVAILGSSTAKCTTVINIIHAAPENEADAGTDGSGGVASGNQIVVPVDAAVDICGNAVSVLGITEAGCMETISEGSSEDDKDEGQEDDEDNGDKDEGQEDDEDNGDKDEDESKEDNDNGDDKGDEEDSGKGDEGDDKPAPSADGELPVTGGALSGLVAAALAAVGAGGTGLYFARKRKAATDE